MLAIIPSTVKNKLTFDFYFAELLMSDRSNIIDCLSDMNNIMYDFMRYFEREYKTGSERITTLDYKFDDNTAGMLLTITFDYWNINSCENGQ